MVHHRALCSTAVVPIKECLCTLFSRLVSMMPHLCLCIHKLYDGMFFFIFVRHEFEETEIISFHGRFMFGYKAVEISLTLFGFFPLSTKTGTEGR